MRISSAQSARRLTLGSSAVAIAFALLNPVAASAAQAAGANAVEAPPKDAPAPAATTQDATEIVVTGSRIERAGYSQPTPTTVLGATELREGNRASIQQVLNDQPQFRATVTQATTVGLTGAGTAPVDLRGLGTARTLTLINGRRFVGENNLNFVPQNLVSRVDVVTGGASAAYGSGAVAGVVNIFLNDKLQGLSLGTQYGLSSRNDGRRYGLDGSFGASFAGGRGHVMTGAEYVNDEGIGPEGRLTRPEQGAGIVRIDPTSATDQRTRLTADVNSVGLATGGLITKGVLAGQVFNSDGSLRPFRGGTVVGGSQIGGRDAYGLFDNLYVASPTKRFTSYSRVSFDLGGASIWADAAYGRASTNYPFIPDLALSSVTVSASNPFLSPAIRNQLALAGETSLTAGGYLPQYAIRLNNVRKNYEGAVGVDGRFGRFKYNAHYSHGEVISDGRLENSRLAIPFANAINAVAGPGGTPVCAINADSNPANDVPACAPVNPLGPNNVSAAAIAYTTGAQTVHTRSTLDAAAAEIQGDIFSLPAGPLTVVLGAETRYEKLTAQPGTFPVRSQFAFPVFGQPVEGKFNVKEVFGEVAVPVFNADDRYKLDLNGAARYSDYSTSGGIWSWKAGATLRLFNDLLLRGTESRDIRSPSIDELFRVQNINLATAVDAQAAQFASTPGYNPTPLATTFTGGNRNLVPEIGRTRTIGGSYSPSFFKGFSFSVDYYKIKIKGAIFTLNASQLSQACAAGSAAACANIRRDPTTNTITTVFANFQNLAQFSTEGYDLDATYSTRLSNISPSLPGTLRLRALATYIKHFIIDTGVTRVDSAGDVGDATGNANPHWKGTFSASFQGKLLGLDARVRYVGGGKYNHLLDPATSSKGIMTGLVNNRISSRTYLDLGAQFRIADRLTLFGNVNNVFDKKPPLTQQSSAFYDVVGTYFSGGARVKF